MQVNVLEEVVCYSFSFCPTLLLIVVRVTDVCTFKFLSLQYTCYKTINYMQQRYNLQTEISQLMFLFCNLAVLIVVFYMLKLERTFIAIKPDGVQRGLIAEIISRFERKGFKLVAIKIVLPSKEFAEKHYHDLKERPFFNGLCDFLSSGPVVAMVR
ncbi:hypothetical protein BHM03_00042407 [Ensete ventricosum]|nr:hypothetical protein BHM03_00042407 [Ensete ventricosum]